MQPASFNARNHPPIKMQNPTSYLSRRSIVIGSLCGLLSLVQPATGDVTLMVTDTIGDPHLVDISLSDPASRFFTFRLTLLATTEVTTGLTYFLETPDFAGNGQFRIVSRDTTGSSFSDLTTSNATVSIQANALLDPRNNNDLGATVPDVLNAPNPAGTYFVADYVLEALSTISPGTYTIETAFQSATGDEPDFDELSVAAATYTVHIVPEPVTGCLFVLGGALLGWRRRMKTA